MVWVRVTPADPSHAACKRLDSPDRGKATLDLLNRSRHALMQDLIGPGIPLSILEPAVAHEARLRIVRHLARFVPSFQIEGGLKPSPGGYWRWPAIMRLDWDGCDNVRDLGGLDCRNGGRTRERQLVRGDDIGRLSPRGIQDMVNYGIQLIIDLREDEEVARFPMGRTGGPLPAAIKRIRVPLLSYLFSGSATAAPFGKTRRRAIWTCSNPAREEWLRWFAHWIARGGGRGNPLLPRTGSYGCRHGASA